MLHAAIGCYMVLHGVSWCYTILQGVTRCYRVLHGVTRCYTVFHSSRSEFIISLRAKRAQCVNRVWVLASCKLAALIFTCIYPMVSAMTSYSSLTSRRISIHEELSFHRLQNNVYYR